MQFQYFHYLGSRQVQKFLPNQKLFYLGGIGTLRGYDYKEFSGTTVTMLNLEYLMKINKKIGLTIFIDTGACWNGHDKNILSMNYKLARFKHSAGFGITEFGGDAFWSILIANRLSGEKSNNWSFIVQFNNFLDKDIFIPN